MCRGPARAGSGHCWCCLKVCSVLGEDPRSMPRVLPMAVFTPGDAWHVVLRRYKDAPVAAARRYFSDLLTSETNRFVTDHGDCLRAETGGFDSYCVVPTSRPHLVSASPHPLQAVLSDARALDAFDRLRLSAARSVDHLQPAADSFVPVGASTVAGRRVLVIDDSWVTGSRALSAVMALKATGATVAGVFVLGRLVDPSASPSSRSWWAMFCAGTRPYGRPADRPCTPSCSVTHTRNSSFILRIRGYGCSIADGVSDRHCAAVEASHQGGGMATTAVAGDQGPNRLRNALWTRQLDRYPETVPRVRIPRHRGAHHDRPLLPLLRGGGGHAPAAALLPHVVLVLPLRACDRERDRCLHRVHRRTVGQDRPRQPDHLRHAHRRSGPARDAAHPLEARIRRRLLRHRIRRGRDPRVHAGAHAGLLAAVGHAARRWGSGRSARQWGASPRASSPPARFRTWRPWQDQFDISGVVCLVVVVISFAVASASCPLGSATS